MKLLFTLCACLLLHSAAAQWTNVGPGGEGLIAVSFADANNGWTCGVNGILYRTQNGGATWQSIPNFYTFRPHNNLTAIAATSTDRVVFLWQQPSVATPATIYYSINANNTTYYAYSLTGSGDYNNLSFRQAGLGLAVGNTGTLAISRDQGLTWASLTSGTQNNLFAVDSPDGSVAYAVGSNGTVRKATGPGFTTWQALNSTKTTRLTSVWFVDAQRGYVVGEGGTALRTTNGGSTWSAMPVSTLADLNAVRFLTASVGFIAGDVGTLLLTTDGGQNWRAENSGTYETLSSISAAPDGSATWVVGGGGTVLKRGPVALASQSAQPVRSWQTYPNPFTTTLTLTGPALPTGTHARLLDATGRCLTDQVLGGPVNRDSWSLSFPAALPGGNYFLQLALPGQFTQTQQLLHLP